MAEGLYDGRLWADFCDRLKALGDEMLRPESPIDDFNRAEGYRYLSRLLRDGLMRQVEFKDPRFPVLYDLNNAWVSIGGNPDNDYLMSFIDGRLDYRLTGRRNSVNYLGISTKAGGYEKDGALAPSGFIDSHNIKFAPDGSFEIAMSAREQPGNWLPMTEKTTNLIIRQTFMDRTKEVAADFKIECLTPNDGPAPLDPIGFPAQLDATLAYIKGNLAVSGNWTRQFQTTPNTFYPLDQGIYLKAGGDPTIFYAQGYWQLGSTEVLVVEVPTGECGFWNFQINNYWSEVVGFNQKPSSHSKASAVPDADGIVRLAVAHRDPGLLNWIPTLGHDQGSMIFRIIDGVAPEFPRARVVVG